MKLGLIARADNTGLGIQTWEFYRHMKPYRTMVVDISRFNNNKQYPERYEGVQKDMFIKGFPTVEDIELFLDDLDVVFVAESAYVPVFYHMARARGVKTAVQYNYEFMDWLISPSFPRPDMFIAPSKWNYAKVQQYCDINHVKHVYLHCPVDREKLPYRERTSVRKFLHIAGRAAAHDRNGTETVIRASRLLKTGAELKVHFQGEQGLGHQATHPYDYYKNLAQDIGDDKNLTVTKQEYDNYEDIYAEGDVLLLPRRYGGNCLPMNEALSTGMPVLMPNISPNNEFLPEAWLMPAEKISQFTPRTFIDIYDVAPEALAAAIDSAYNNFTADQFNVANYLADTISWETMAPKYRDALEDLCNQL